MALMFFSLFVYNLTSVAKSVLEVEAAHFFLENNFVFQLIIGTIIFSLQI